MRLPALFHVALSLCVVAGVGVVLYEGVAKPVASVCASLGDARALIPGCETIAGAVSTGAALTERPAISPLRVLLSP